MKKMPIFTWGPSLPDILAAWQAKGPCFWDSQQSPNMARYCAVEGGSLQIRLKRRGPEKVHMIQEIIDHLDKGSKKTWYMRILSYHNLSPEELWCPLPSGKLTYITMENHHV